MKVKGLKGFLSEGLSMIKTKVRLLIDLPFDDIGGLFKTKRTGEFSKDQSDFLRFCWTFIDHTFS